MTRVEARRILEHYDDIVWQDAKGITCGKLKEAFDMALDSLKNPWHKASKELPKVDTEVVCKMKGVPHTEHFICKWDGKYWWHWGWLNPDAQGWFGLNTGWEIVEWKEI